MYFAAEQQPSARATREPEDGAAWLPPEASSALGMRQLAAVQWRAARANSDGQVDQAGEHAAMAAAQSQAHAAAAHAQALHAQAQAQVRQPGQPPQLHGAPLDFGVPHLLPGSELAAIHAAHCAAAHAAAQPSVLALSNFCMASLQAGFSPVLSFAKCPPPHRPPAPVLVTSLAPLRSRRSRRGRGNNARSSDGGAAQPAAAGGSPLPLQRAVGSSISAAVSTEEESEERPPMPPSSAASPASSTSAASPASSTSAASPAPSTVRSGSIDSLAGVAGSPLAPAPSRWPRDPSSVSLFLQPMLDMLIQRALASHTGGAWAANFGSDSDMARVRAAFETAGCKLHEIFPSSRHTSLRRFTDENAPRPDAETALAVVGTAAPAPRTLEQAALSLMVLARSLRGPDEQRKLSCQLRDETKALAHELARELFGQQEVGDKRATERDSGGADGPLSGALALSCLVSLALLGMTQDLAALCTGAIERACLRLGSPCACSGNGGEGDSHTSSQEGTPLCSPSPPAPASSPAAAPSAMPMEPVAEIVATVAVVLAFRPALSPLALCALIESMAAQSGSALTLWEACLFLLFFLRHGMPCDQRLLREIGRALSPEGVASPPASSPRSKASSPRSKASSPPTDQQLPRLPEKVHAQHARPLPRRSCPMYLTGPILCAFAASGSVPPTATMLGFFKRAVEQMITEHSGVTEMERMAFACALCSIDPGPAFPRLCTARLRAALMPAPAAAAVVVMASGEVVQAASVAARPVGAAARGRRSRGSRRRGGGNWGGRGGGGAVALGAGGPALGAVMPSAGFAAFGTPGDASLPLTHVFWALAKMRHRVETALVDAFCARLPGRILGCMSAEELALLLSGLALHAHYPGTATVAEALRCLSTALAAMPRALPPRAIAESMTALATLAFCACSADGVVANTPSESGGSMLGASADDYSGSVALLVRRFAEQCDDATGEDLVRLLRALAVVGCPPQARSDTARVAVAIAARISDAEAAQAPPPVLRATLAHLHQLAEYGRSAQREVCGRGPVVPTVARAVAEALHGASAAVVLEGWRSHAASKARIVGPLQSDVSDVLCSVGVSHSRQRLSGGAMVALALADFTIAVEIEDGDCILRNTHAPCGYALLHRHLVAASGWRVVVVSSYEWERCHTLHLKQQLLVTKLDTAISAFSATRAPAC